MRALTFVLLVCCALLGCATSGQRQAVGVSASGVFRLTDAQRLKAMQQAYAGDAAAARKLADEAIHVRDDYRTGIAWLRLAASYGDQDAKQALKVYLEGLRDAKKP